MGWLGYKLLALQGYGLIDHGLTPLSALCNQSLNEKPKNISSQISKMAAFIASGFLLPAYSAFIISFITIDKKVLPFTDFDTFIKDGTYRLTSLYFKFPLTYFKVITI